MKVFDLFPTKVLTDTIDIPNDYLDQVTDKILDKDNLVSIMHSDKDFISHDQHILDKVPLLKKQITKYINYYASIIKLKTVEYQISSSWVYLSRRGNRKGNWHLHINSNLSGVFYLTEGAPIVFTNYEDLQKQYPFYPGDGKNGDESGEEFILPIYPKQIVIFPSYLYHSVKEHEFDKERISIAFNAIPLGEIGDVTSKITINKI
jgi:uncharacterized protein (TIGR02466 family)|tara:strand:- start:544 stop:1158 length:615 start_codon:yes stop_codon:yes gene_type:complete